MRTFLMLTILTLSATLAQADLLSGFRCTNDDHAGCKLMLVMGWGNTAGADNTKMCAMEEMGEAADDMDACLQMARAVLRDGLVTDAYLHSGRTVHLLNDASCVWVNDVDEVERLYPGVVTVRAQAFRDLYNGFAMTSGPTIVDTGQ